MSLAEFVSPGVCNTSSPFADIAQAEPATVRRADPHAAALHQRLGARLCLARKLAGLSQTEAGQLLGVTFQQYRKYETGENRISAIALHRLAWHFHLSTEWFHVGGEQETDTQRSRSEPMGPEAAMLVACFNAIRSEDDRALLLKLAARLVSRSDTGEQHTKPSAALGGQVDGQSAKRVLLVDDDPSALVVASAFLRKAGLEVVTAASGDQALELLAAGTPVHALITDHAMPGVSGLKLVELVLERRPNLPALIITGYGRDGELGHLPECVGILAKPFARDEFIKRVQALLGVSVGG